MSILRSVVSRIRSLVGGLPFFNEETRVARYITLAESTGGFTVPDPSAGLPLSDRHFTNINAPGVVSAAPPVIFYRTLHTGNPRFSVRLNTTRLTIRTLSDDGLHSWHEIIPSGALRSTGNELVFNLDGDGSVTFSDVVVLYTSSESTVKTPPEVSPD